ncbi:MAG TPA: hypothetical protein PLY34_02775 [Ferruginibacter sp.]|nr:hypothetical protein [Ferruginibacter sp.]HPH92235.1 hypothetical protein [Ferruginibacter sp.]
MNSTIAKFIYWGILFGVCSNAVRIYFSQMDAQVIAEDEVYGWYFKLNYFGNVVLCACSIASFFLYKKYFPSFINTCYILMILAVTAASIPDFDKIFARPTFFFSIKGIGTYINFGLLYFVADTERFPKVLKLFYYLCFAFIVAGFINLAQVGLGASRREFMLTIKDLAFYCMWVFPYFFLQDEEDKKKNLINLAAFMLIVVLVFSTGARSYLIICALVLMIKFSKQLKSKNGVFAIIGMLLLIGIGYVVLLNSEYSGTLEGAATNLSERSDQDTRSEQILDFLGQYDMDYLVQGVGPKGTWYWHSIESKYEFLDNQFLLLAWWAGLPAILIYLIFLVRSMFVKSEILLFQNIKGVKLMIGLWIAACLGFAIYVTISSEPYYYFISFMIGINACQYTKIWGDPEEFEEEAV